ncbi:MAG: hypothetical protein EOO88_15295 [Pedobacter sp.]|nr:MAG: hypothetical protein EOO88_15295 [Pedobacter sp.]
MKKGCVSRLLSMPIGLMHSLFGHAQSLPTPTLITEQQGLLQAFASAIVQDEKGFIWAATRDSLSRFGKVTDNPVATYTGLPPGTYTLLLNASNTSGRWRAIERLKVGLALGIFSRRQWALRCSQAGGGPTTNAGTYRNDH